MYKAQLIVNKLNQKSESSEIANAGDFCIVDNFSTADKKGNVSEIGQSAMVLKCPFCRMDMATTKAHKITKHHNWLGRLFRIKPKYSVKPMVQCPYNPIHRFNINNNKIKAL